MQKSFVLILASIFSILSFANAESAKSFKYKCSTPSPSEAPLEYIFEFNLDGSQLDYKVSGGFESRLAVSKVQVSELDYRCGTSVLPLESAINFDVTDQHVWGQDVLQLPREAIAHEETSFSANLHICSYDGEWSSSGNVPLNCVVQ